MLVFGIGGNIDDIGGVENSIKSLIAASYCSMPITLICHAHVDGRITQYQAPNHVSLTLIEYKARSWKKSPLTRIYRDLFSNNPDARVICRHHKHVIAASKAGFKVVYLVPSMIHSQVRTELDGPASIEKLRLLVFGLLNHWAQIAALKAADCVAAFSITMKEQIERVVPVKNLKAPILICKPGIDIERFHPGDETERKELRVRFKVPEDSICLVIVSRLVSGKGINLAIESMPELGPRYHLMIVGDGLRREEYETLVKQLTPQVSIDFWGSRPNTEAFYRCADIFLMTSRAESLGQTILEAGASGLPIVAFSKRAGVVTATEELGLDQYISLAHEYSIESLVEAIRCAKGRIAKRSEIHSHFHDRFSWRKLLEQLTQAC